MSIEIATDENIGSLLATDKLVLLKFGAKWCNPCKLLKPALESLSKDLSDTLVVLDSDIDDNPELSAKYRVMSVPTMILLLNGKELSRKIGNTSRATIETWINLTMED